MKKFIIVVLLISVSLLNAGEFKPVTTKVIRYGAEPQKLSVDITGLQDLWLLATSGDDDYHHDRACWGDPVLVAKDGSRIDLTTLTPTASKMGWGSLMVDKGIGTKPLRIGNTVFKKGLFAHAPSSLHFKIDGNYVRFEASVGIENTGQKGGSSEFRVLSRYDDTRMQPYPKGKQSKKSASKPATPKKAAEPAANVDAIEMAIKDMAHAWPERFKDADRLLAELKATKAPQKLEVFQRRVLLRNPLLDFDKLLVIRDSSANRFPANWQSNSSMRKTVASNDLALISIKAPERAESLLQPDNSAIIVDVDLHFDADKILFSSMGSNGAWQVMEMDLTSKAVRQVTQTHDRQINNYDACYLPDGRVLFTSTAPYIGVPCVNGGSPVACAFRCEADGSEMEQLTFDQEHTWCPQVMSDGRIMYLRWEYADLPHSNSRILMTMNPDGTNQRSCYGTSSFWPNGIFYARQIPGNPSKFAGIVTGHHGLRRQGELVLFDTAKGYMEADGVVQRLPGHGKTVEPVVEDRLARRSNPRFLHPYPLSSKYFLASSMYKGKWAIYLVDVFDNMTLIKAEDGVNLFEPVPLQKTQKLQVIPDRTRKGEKEATVFISDIYEGPGLQGVPRGEVKKLRLFTYTYGYAGMGGLYGVLGMDGPWDMRRILGTVPVEYDGSALFKVPANTPISIQPLDDEGKAVQLMRSWFVARPAENLSCIGCHEAPGTAPIMKSTKAAKKGPADITPWRGPARNFEFKREVQPVLDRYCLSCHGSSKPAEGKMTIMHKGQELPYLGGDVMLQGWHTRHAGAGKGGKFSVSYFNLFRYTRGSGEESEMKLLTPMEFHADTCELIMMMQQGHPAASKNYAATSQVKLDEEALDRLVTWIDLNTPYHGRWSEISGAMANSAENRRAEMRKLYAGVDEKHEEMPELPATSAPVAPEVRGPRSEVDKEFGCQISGVRSEGVQDIDLAAGVKMSLVHVPGGNCSKGNVKDLWMGRLEVSNEQFAQFDAEHDSRHEDRHGYQFGVTGYPVNEPKQPAVRLSWKQADEFCKWLSEKSGKRVRLPSELEWEWACRAGTETDMNYGDVDADFSKHGNMADITLHNFSGNPYKQDWKMAAYNNPENIFDNWIPQITAVNDGGFLSEPGGKYEANGWGLHDMHGNVAEWTASEYSKGKRVVKGGSWFDRPKLCTSSFRRGYRDYQKVYNVGFRVLVEE